MTDKEYKLSKTELLEYLYQRIDKSTVGSFGCLNIFIIDENGNQQVYQCDKKEDESYEDHLERAIYETKKKYPL